MTYNGSKKWSCASQIAFSTDFVGVFVLLPDDLHNSFSESRTKINIANKQCYLSFIVNTVLGDLSCYEIYYTNID